MKINIVCVGKIKEKYFTDAIAEYVKRLKKYVDIKIIEVADEKCPENLSIAEELAVKSKEGKAIIKNLGDSFVVALDIKGKEMGSVELSEFLQNKMVSGISSFVFVIGGSLGLSEEVVKRADFRLSFSPMTFPHQLMRVILLEQLYRTQRILKNEPYHK